MTYPFPPNTPVAEQAKIIQSLFGSQLDEAIRTFEPAINPSGSMDETWRIADKWNKEAWHKFSLDCRTGVWRACFSNLFHSTECPTPQEAILQALLMDKHNLTYTFEGEKLVWMHAL